MYLLFWLDEIAPLVVLRDMQFAPDVGEIITVHEQGIHINPSTKRCRITGRDIVVDITNGYSSIEKIDFYLEEVVK